jgi:peptide/nickel transport system permease protein
METLNESSLDASQEKIERRVSYYYTVLKRFLTHRPGMFGLAVIVITLLSAVFAENIAPYDPYLLNPPNRFQAPSSDHLMGTDNLGSDILSRIIFGARYSLIIAISVVILSMTIGVTLGLISGYYGGFVDEIVTRSTDAFMAVPSFFIYITALSMWDVRGIWTITAIMGFMMWPTFAKVVRSEVLSMKERPFVEAGRSMGASDFRLITRYILPNIWGTIVIIASFRMAAAILTETGLNFIGLGDPTVCSWGSMITRAHRSGAQLVYWWAPVFPGLAITIVTWAFNLFGDGLRDSLDIKQENRG